MALACRLTTPELRERERWLVTSLGPATEAIEAVPGGYAVTFRGDGEVIARVAELIGLERICCPFLQFDLRIPPDEGAILLTLTGPEGTIEFLDATLIGALRSPGTS